NGQTLAPVKIECYNFMTKSDGGCLTARIVANNMSSMTIPQRQSEILNIARMSGRVTVDDLSRRFELSAQTIRKDPNELCERRSLTRVHGGAIIASGIENLSYEARRFVAADEK